jgi:putative flavoprotein involved in K+ transport
MARQIETMIVGGGQAGLAASYYLGRQGCEHIVLEGAPQAGEAWRNHRWDSFTLVTPNWQIRLPGAEYQGDDPDGYMPRDEIVAYLERYIDHYHLPVHFGAHVTAVEPGPRGRYVVRAGEDTFEAANVIVATGAFQRSQVPPSAAGLPAGVQQLPSDEYRNPDALSPGAVLVVGSAQSGCQIAEELYQSGRQVYLCVGSAGRVPRRHRGRDITWWLHQMGWFDQTVASLPSPRARFAANPHVTGKNGGHTLNLHQFARDGVVLLGRLRGAREGKILLAADLYDSLAGVDKFEADLLQRIDTMIRASGMDAPPEHLPVLRDGYQVPEIRELDLRAAGITTTIWAAGYTHSFDLVKLPVVDEFGYPIQQRGVTAYPGLYFMGLHWLSTRKSGLLLGVGDDADFIASRIATGDGRPQGK